METTTEARRGIWLVLWAAFTVAPVLYYIVGAMIGETPANPELLRSLRPAFAAFAIVQLAAGAYLLTRAPRARSDVQGLGALLGGESLATPEAFQTGFVVATALVESAAILGFVLHFLGAPLFEYLPYGAGSLAVMLAIGLPSGLGYWSEYERTTAGGTGPIG